MRLGYSRLGYFRPWVKVWINGVERGLSSGGGAITDPRVRIDRMTIQHNLNHLPDTASFRVSGFVPSKGHDVKIYVGGNDLAHQEFGGVVLAVNQTYEAGKEGAAFVVYDLDCIDYTWLLSRRRVTKKYTNQSATAIVLDLMTSFTSGFTTTGVVANLATIDEISFTDEDMSDALSKVAQRIGGYWYVDYAKNLRFFLTNTETAGSITDASKRTAREIMFRDDLSQVATRARGYGGGSVALSDVSVGQTTLPVQETSWYSASGGTVTSGPQQITYAGIAGTSEGGSPTGYVAPPPATHTVAPEPGGPVGAMDSNALYGYAMTYVTTSGETTPSATVSGLSGTTSLATRLDNLAVPTDPVVTGKHIYRTEGGGSVLKKLTTGGPLAPSVTGILPDTTGDASLGAVPPTGNTAGAASVVATAGSTTLPVEDTSQFQSGGGWADIGGQVFRYTGRSASSGPGTLTGIPASGIGALTAPVRAGTVKNVPHLTVIPTSGAGSILYTINEGDNVDIVITRNDTTAQTTLAALVGGDGVHETTYTEGRLGSVELTARLDAILAERKDPHRTVTFTTQDPTVQVGRTITITLTTPAISGTFRVQRVELSALGFDGGHANAKVQPVRRVEVSSRRFSFEDTLRQIKGRVA